MLKKSLIIGGIVALVMTATVASAAKPESFQTWATNKINNLEQRLGLVETAVTANTSEIQSINDQISALGSRDNELGDRITGVEGQIPEQQPMPELSVNITDAHIICSALQPHCSLEIWMESKINGRSFDSNWNIWGVAHFPLGDRTSFGTTTDIRGFGWGDIPLTDLPTFGTPVDVDVYAHWGGKTINNDLTITDWRQQPTP